MTAQTLLIAGILMIFVAIIVFIGTVVIGASEPEGVARSLAIIRVGVRRFIQTRLVHVALSKICKILNQVVD